MRLINKMVGDEVKVLMFDIDGTLCTQESSDYMRAKPFVDRINLINELRRGGKYIKLFTSRGITSGIDWKEQTTAQLLSWGLEYDELIFGKPHYDLFIDDKSIYSEDFRWSN